MLTIEQEGNTLRIDAREAVSQGLHPKKRILDLIESAESGSLIEVHVPHPAPPLVSAIEALGLNTTVKQLASDHYRLLCVKL